MFSSPKQQFESEELTITQMDNLLRAPTKEDNYDNVFEQPCNTFSLRRISPGPVRAFQMFHTEDIIHQDSSMTQQNVEMAPSKKQTLLITSIKDRAQPSHVGSQISPARSFELPKEESLRSTNFGYKQQAQKKIGKLNMEHVHQVPENCLSPTSNMDDCKLVLHSERYLKAPVKANIASCNTCSSQDQNVTVWMANKFDLSEKNIPATSFDSPSCKKEANFIQCDTIYQDTTDYTDKKKCF